MPFPPLITAPGQAWKATTTLLGTYDVDPGDKPILLAGTVVAGGAGTGIYREGQTGELKAGTLTAPDGTAINRIRSRSVGAELVLNKSTAVPPFRDLFDQGIWDEVLLLTTRTGDVLTVGADDIDSGGSSFIDFTVPFSFRSALNGIGAGDRLVLAVLGPTP